MACIDFKQVAIGPVLPLVEQASPVRRERLFHCEHFLCGGFVAKRRSRSALTGTPRVLVCLDGNGALDHGGTNYPVSRGDVVLLPAEVGVCAYRPRGVVSMLEIALPESP